MGVEGSVPNHANIKRDETSAGQAEETTLQENETNNQRVEKGVERAQGVDPRVRIE